MSIEPKAQTKGIRALEKLVLNAESRFDKDPTDQKIKYGLETAERIAYQVLRDHHQDPLALHYLNRIKYNWKRLEQYNSNR